MLVCRYRVNTVGLLSKVCIVHFPRIGCNFPWFSTAAGFESKFSLWKPFCSVLGSVRSSCCSCWWIDQNTKQCSAMQSFSALHFSGVYGSNADCWISDQAGCNTMHSMLTWCLAQRSLGRRRDCDPRRGLD